MQLRVVGRLIDAVQRCLWMATWKMVLPEKVQDSYKWNNHARHINPCSCPRGRPRIIIWFVCECMHMHVSVCLQVTTRFIHIFSSIIHFLFEQQQRFYYSFWLASKLKGNEGGKREINTKTSRQPEREKWNTFKSQYAIWHGHWTTTV